MTFDINNARTWPPEDLKAFKDAAELHLHQMKAKAIAKGNLRRGKPVYDQNPFLKPADWWQSHRNTTQDTKK